MNSTTRHEVLEKLHKMAKFADLKSNRERVEFFLDHVMDFKQIKSAIRVNIEQAKQKNSKSLSLAKNYKIEADMHMIQASLGSMEERESHLQNALKSYGKVSFICIKFNKFVIICAVCRQFCTNLYILIWILCPSYICVKHKCTIKWKNMKLLCTQ